MTFASTILQDAVTIHTVKHCTDMLAHVNMLVFVYTGEAMMFVVSISQCILVESMKNSSVKPTFRPAKALISQRLEISLYHFRMLNLLIRLEFNL